MGITDVGTAAREPLASRLINGFLSSKKEAENPLFELYDSELELNNGIMFGGNHESEYNKITTERNGDDYKEIVWEDVEDNISEHGKIMKHYKNRT